MVQLITLSTPTRVVLSWAVTIWKADILLYMLDEPTILAKTSPCTDLAKVGVTEAGWLWS